MSFKGGMFISDSARERLNITLDEGTFDRLKKEINKSDDPNEPKKCFITKQHFPLKDGLFLDKDWISRSMEKNLESADRLWKSFKDNKEVVCFCGNKMNYGSLGEITCGKCGKNINVKKYGRRIKLPMTRKIALKLYIKFLGGKSNV